MKTFVNDTPINQPNALRKAINAVYRADETAIVKSLAAQIHLTAEEKAAIEARAFRLVEAVRANRIHASGIDAFMHEYGLSSKEGIALMCLAEALLRIPDRETADALIRDKLTKADWARHAGHSTSIFVNASTWALMLTGELLKRGETGEEHWWALIRTLMQRTGEPVVRQAVAQAMRLLGNQFVLGRTIREALRRAKSGEARNYRYSFDMLGEAAKTGADAERYFHSYAAAIRAICESADGSAIEERPSISVKLSALHPRYEPAQQRRVMAELWPRLLSLCQMARDGGIGLCVDAEEAERLDLSLDLFEKLATDASLKGWQGLGLAVQAYQKRCAPLIDWLDELAARSGRRLMVRLVKGAYWDTEIKRSQELGLPGYPVFTRKVSTDVSYLACAQKLLANERAFYPCFATHNAHTLAAVVEMAGKRPLEFQRLHGMGDALYNYFLKSNEARPVRVYAPVGDHEDLLAYLVRRLLENGANSSFVNRIVDEHLPISEIIADPVERVLKLDSIPHPGIPLPADLYGKERRNSAGLDLSDRQVLADLQAGLARAAEKPIAASPIIGGRPVSREARPVASPADRSDIAGMVAEAVPSDAIEAMSLAAKAQTAWNARTAEARASILEKAANDFDAHRLEFLQLLIREGGKTLPDAIADLREAVDFLRYYAMRARKDFASPLVLPGPTGEANTLALSGRGVFACISPWNFPLAIFTGQIAAALAAGNAVIAKPAEQTPLIGFKAVSLLHGAGVPCDVLHFLPGDGPSLGKAILRHTALSGVAFTGSTETAQLINRTLAARNGPILPLIAETGGQNAMIVDSSALPEQVTRDVLTSAFQSAGQRCSALRVLFLQEDVADKILDMIAGATVELRVGDPRLIETDIGPVIDEDARHLLEAHAAKLNGKARLIAAAKLSPECERGTFFAPRLYEIENMSMLEREVFGPILHVIRYEAGHLDKVADAINATGYGLTAAIHSRIDETVAYLTARLKVGNIYVNRSQIGAVVGVQPFGGEGLSGTGPKAGGPHYLLRFATERSLSIDTTAAGGNASLLSLGA